MRINDLYNDQIVFLHNNHVKPSLVLDYPINMLQITFAMKQQESVQILIPIGSQKKCESGNIKQVEHALTVVYYTKRNEII